MSDYVCGFMFTRDFFGGEVALIQKGSGRGGLRLWNGIGGKVERKDASSYDAMVRYSEKHALFPIRRWKKFATVKWDGGQCEFFKACDIPPTLHGRIKFWDVEKLPQALAPDVRWLIPLALGDSSEAVVRRAEFK